jgi:hypothetical protein|tara:strand:- start:539 stop:820 length:282 start_codon:yes stop_codon:yes gene_type:complete
MASPVSKASSLPAISVGFAISILVATWVAGARFEGMERADAQAVVLIQDVADRQKKYIGTTGLLTEQIMDLQESVVELEREIALLKVKLELNK